MTRPTTAIMLAAGMGVRLGAAGTAQPKALIHLEGETLLGRALRLLRAHGLERVVIVVGFKREAFDSLAAEPGVELVENARFAETGTMVSLACALEVVSTGFLLLESDLLYEPRALALALDHPSPDLVLASGPTNAGDEVWIETAPGRSILRNMSKDRAQLGEVAGELVGICKISAPLAASMRAELERFVAAHGHARACYETDALVAAARTREIAVHVEPELLWGEIDYDAHYRRVRDVVLPAIRARLGDGT